MGRFFTEIWQYNDFQNGGRPPCWNFKICSFCHVARVDLLFCSLIQNFAEIGQSVNDLWPKKRFSRWRPLPSWILKISIFGYVTVTGFNIWFVVYQISSKSDNFSLRYSDFTIFKMAAVRHVGFKNLQFLSRSPCRPAVLLPHTKFCWNRTIGRWFMAKRAIFKMAAAVILNFKNFNFWSRDRNRVQYLM